MNLIHAASDATHDAGVTLVELHGEVGPDSAEFLHDDLVGGIERNTDVLVDLAGVTLIDSASLSVLVEVSHLAHRRGHQVCLTAVSAPVRRTLAATMLDDFFALYANRQQAIDDLTAPAGGGRPAHTSE